MDLGVPPPVRDALTRAVADMDFGYQVSVFRDLCDEVSRRMSDLYGWTVPPERVRLFDDVLQAAEVALLCSTKPGDGVVIHTPVYHRFSQSLASADRRVIEQPMVRVDGIWRVDPESWDRVAAEEPSAVLLCNPHNPLGRVFTRPELEEIADFAERLDLLVIADEVHAELLHPGHAHIPFATLGSDVASRTVTVSSASKAFNIAGLRCAHAIVDHDPTLEGIDGLPMHLTAQVNSLGALASLVAYRDGGRWLAETVETLTRNRDHIVERITAELPGVLTTVPDATYLAWLDVRRFGLGDHPADAILARGRIALTDGEGFGSGGAGHVRLNFGTWPEILDVVLDRLLAALSG